jgi:Uma2 family endonuclease
MSRQVETEIPQHRLTVDDYYRMGEAGILEPDSRVELIDGVIIDMAPMGSRHAYVVAELVLRLISAIERLGIAAEVRCQLPVRLGTYSEPEPDLAVVVRRGKAYSERHPVAHDVLLLIEVCDSSAAYDRRVKVPLYARHGIRECWVLDLSAKQLQVCRDPYEGRYRDTLDANRLIAQPVQALPDLSIDLEDLLSL